MILGFITLLIFLFTTYELSKEDFIFLRKGITTDDIFNTIFLGLPIALLGGRLVYVLLHPSWRYLNPLIFFVVPYFPGLSIIGGIIASWLFLLYYTKKKKYPYARILDILGISFLVAFSIGIFLQAGATFLSSKSLALVDSARGFVGIAIFIFLLLQFLKSRWIEGSFLWFSLVVYSFLALVSTLFSYILHQPISIPTLILTTFFFTLSLIFFVKKILFDGKRKKA